MDAIFRRRSLWRKSDPALDEEIRTGLVNELLGARRAFREADCARHRKIPVRRHVRSYQSVDGKLKRYRFPSQP